MDQNVDNCPDSRVVEANPTEGDVGCLCACDFNVRESLNTRIKSLRESRPVPRNAKRQSSNDPVGTSYVLSLVIAMYLGKGRCNYLLSFA